jgi:hypothetical protein
MYKLGKRPPVHDDRTLQFRKYASMLPAPPLERNYMHDVPEYPMYSNDTLSDCVAAAAGHMLQNWTSYAGKYFQPTDQDVIAFYEFSGFDPADPSSDQGWDLLSALKVWRTSGLACHQIAAFVQLTTGNWNELQQAIALFGNAYIGVALPDAVVPDTGVDWTTIPWIWTPGMTQNSANGHCIPAMGYESNNEGSTCRFVSWAARMVMGKEFYENITDECFAVVTSDWIEADGQSPSGFDLATLQADLALVTA